MRVFTKREVEQASLQDASWNWIGSDITLEWTHVFVTRGIKDDVYKVPPGNNRIKLY